jgi:hypothetical protein
MWNGLSRVTNYLIPWKISAVMTATDFTALPASVTVSNPAGRVPACIFR